MERMQFIESYPVRPRRKLLKWLLSFVVLLCVVGAVMIRYVYVSMLPPSTFPTDTDLTIGEGFTISDIADTLEHNGYVQSSLLFYVYMGYTFPDATIQAGTYRFDTPQSVQSLAYLLTHGEAVAPTLKVTFPEGYTVKNINEYLDETNLRFSVDAILDEEGFLFPDTYFISMNMTVDDVLVLMHENYEARIGPLRPLMVEAGLSETETIILASIIEREANDPESMRMVAGILRNRLRIDMPLQVDAVFEYLLGKTSAELTTEDLELDSPYNTYIHTGLPPTPIANPGVEAITAVLEATPSPYLYYLTGNDGKFYYAETFEEHKQNKARYLR